MVCKRNISMVDSVESEDALRYTKRQKCKESPFLVTPKVTTTLSHICEETSYSSSPSIHHYEEGTSEQLAVKKDSTPEDLTELIKTFCEMYEVPESLFSLTVRIGNKYYNKRKGYKGNGLLIVLTSLVIAWKFEEQDYPPIEWILDVIPIGFQKKDIVAMEVAILSTLEYRIPREEYTVQ